MNGCCEVAEATKDRGEEEGRQMVVAWRRDCERGRLAMLAVSSCGSGDYHHRRTMKILEALRDHLEEVGKGEIDEEDDVEEVGEEEGFEVVASAKRHEGKRRDLCQW